MSYRLTFRALAIAVGLCCWSCQYQQPGALALAAVSPHAATAKETVAWPKRAQPASLRIEKQLPEDTQPKSKTDLAPFLQTPDLDDLILQSTLQRMPVIALDPGHGGHDPGAVTADGVHEKDIALSVARQCADALRAQGFRVMLTRTDDHYLPLQQRIDIALADEAGLFISIHANAAWNPDARGAEVFYSDGMFQPAESADLAAACFHALTPVTPWPDRAVKPAEFHVLRENPIPSALVELGFMTNEDEIALLTSTIYRSALARALATGIADFALGRNDEVLVAHSDSEAREEEPAEGPWGPW